MSELINDEKKDSQRECVPFVSQYKSCKVVSAKCSCEICVCNKDGRFDCSTTDNCAASGVLVMAGDSSEESSQEPKSWPFDEVQFNKTMDNLQNNLKEKPTDSKQSITKKIIQLEKKDPSGNSTLTITKEIIQSKQNPTNSRQSITKKIIQLEKILPSADSTQSKTRDEMILLKHPDTISSMLNFRNKRGTNEKETIQTKDTNNKISFHATVDELNEDTFKNNNTSGTLTAGKINKIPTRRSDSSDNNLSEHNINFNEPKVVNHITDNKIDNSDGSNETSNTIKLGNHTQTQKNKELSKIIVKELKDGNEVIGDVKAPIITNISFTPENDTLTAMTFIAGNLLNKLWNMEKDGSGSSLEVETMKKEKLANLADLFKEPLNVRQENFLKNALEQLSDAINKAKDVKDIDNLSLCEQIQKAKNIFQDISSTTAKAIEDDKAVVRTSSTEATKLEYKGPKQSPSAKKAISKINNVLGLLTKFDHLRRDLSKLKTMPDNSDKIIDLNEQDVILTENENSTLNVYGRILEKITKLLMPDRNYKKMSSKLKGHNILLEDDDNIKQKFKNIFNTDLSNLTMSAKDKLILDYMTHVANNPDCTKKNKPIESLPKIEGNILLNLSEFFKMKSLTDLVKLLDEEKTKKEVDTTTTTSTTTTMTQLAATKEIPRTHDENLDATKAKLKTHLKSIIDDLMELQRAKGLTPNIKLDDALPCIFKVLNDNDAMSEASDAIISEDKTGKLSDAPMKVLQNLKEALKPELFRRSGGSISKTRPKSAAILERIISNINQLSKVKTRRTDVEKPPKSLEEIKKMIATVSNYSITYKKHALMMEVPPSEKLVLLKTFEGGVNNYLRVLQEIKRTYQNSNSVPREIAKFVDKISFTVKLDNKILNNVERMANSSRRSFGSLDKIEKSKPKQKYSVVKSAKLQQPSQNELHNSEGVSISRNMLINQLIKNRMTLYIKMKESKETMKNDVNYNIAKRVLYLLDHGNHALARELFRIFVMTENIKKTTPTSTTPVSLVEDLPLSRILENKKEPLLQLPNKTGNEMNWLNQDYLIKQLLNMKNL